jgi:ribosome modulation factor
MSAYDEGFEAAKAGQSIGQCKYPEGDLRKAQWMKGWRDWITRNKPDSPDSPDAA